MADLVNMVLPSLAIEVIGWESDAAASGSVSMTLPSLTMASGMGFGAAMTLPSLTLSASGYPGVIGTLACALPAPELAITGSPGVVGSVAMALPMLQMSAGDGSHVTMRLPVPVLDITGATGVVGECMMTSPRLTMVVTGDTQFVAGVAATLPALRMSVTGTVGIVGQVAMGLRQLALAIEGSTGVVGSAQMTLPAMRFAANGHGSIVGNVVMTLPMLVMTAISSRASRLNTSTVAMHTESQALTTYSGFDFNSYAAFNGVYLGAKDDGIFALSGATDAGALIAASARAGIADFGTSHLKRVERCYVGYTATGDMVLRAIADGVTRDYLLTAVPGSSSVHGNHVRIGKGVEARYWQFEIMNKDGADFTLDMVELKPTILRRRVGGRNA